VNKVEEQKIMKFKDEDGNVLEFEVMARIFLEKKEYLILGPLESDAEEFVFRIDRTEDNQEVYNALESDEEFHKVKKEYSRILYNEKKGETND
jgi:hypothetical protein